MNHKSIILGRIVENIRRLRAQLDLTQEALAEQTGLTQTYISFLESGKRGISWDNISRIAEALGVFELDLILSQAESKYLRVDMLDDLQRDKLLKLIEIYLNADKVDPGLIQALELNIEAIHRQIPPAKKSS